ncbi:amino acid adenylation domain-containing protein [Horticoccus sp. 23ND18S-11]|uniref:amino acid adenylation domain-containing protein n=1 Tax=Horticoccus sp. 23ND18S-11 TaxID=3391832 RepID=UPI0039C9AAFF
MTPANGYTPGPVLAMHAGEDMLAANVAALFLAQARATPAAPAIVAREGTTSYGALATRVTSLAHALQQRGVAPEQPIGVLMQRSADLVAVLLAVMHAGAAYVPLDPDDPPARNRRILASSGCQLVLGDRPSIAAVRALLRDQAGPPAPEFVELDHLHPAQPGQPAGPCAPGGRRLAYILFTSGSTGEPKGVEIEHHSVVNLLFTARDLMGFTPSDRYLAASTIGFDISVAELFLPLIAGGSLLLRDRRIWLNPRQLADDIRTQGVTVLQIGPSVWSIALNDIPDFPLVRVAISTGEPVPPALARRIARAGEQAWNLYGPTETTVWSTAHRLTPAGSADENARAISAPIGRPVNRTTIAIIDDTGKPVPAGVRGELCLGGAGVARGYRGNATLTAERFVTLGATGERVYRTGDVVAWNAAGDLEYFGRNDDQLKIRGVRIEPREVEAAIGGHPGVAQAAATWFDGAGSRSIVAAIVPRPGHTLTPTALHAWLETRLPAAMIPSRFVFLPSLPLAPSGKVDRNAIRQSLAAAPATESADTGGVFREMTQTEAVLVQVWQRLLKLDTVGLDDHFFSIGGDSLAAVKMITEVEAIFKISLPVQTAFEAPTLRRLAERVTRANERSPTGSESNYLFPLAEVPGSRPLFFSNVDLRLAVRDTWKAPCSLYSISHWAQGSGFMQAESVGDLARLHLERIQQLQPFGPYRLAGFSFGGLVALEMARQLRLKGETVELLFLLDPMQPFRTTREPQGLAQEGLVTPLDETWRGRISRHVRHLSRRPGGIGTYVAERVYWHARYNPVKQWLIYKLVHLHGNRPNPVSQLIVPRNRWPAFWYSARRMAVRYVAEPYHGRTIAIFPDRGPRFQAWSDLLDPQAELHFVPADHRLLFAEPTLSQWLKPLEAALQERGGAET